ncbi:MAG: Sigma-54 factor interaction domain-containing protein [Nitrospira sp.]|nr:sigma-54-dependent Fis family transcriptional regulator [Nitrospira sp.]ULA59950.1 MAG: Sigma-54 factor interaction domain-containing protein [Nitrospira sp.]
MAGSHAPATSLSPFADPILAARLEALRQLAGGLTDRVAVMDRDLNVVYANDAAWTREGENLSASKPAKCYQAFVQMEDPCGTCPAESVFETREVRTVACNSSGDGTACGMHQAFPLMSASGEVGSVLVLFHKTSAPHTLPKSLHPQKLGRSRPERTESRLGDLVGASSVMHQLFDLIRLVADSSATVLIQGESGTGKELVARTIHQTSYRRDKPFVVVDCGALPETLLESELFGHVKGAFTGASGAKPGLFEEADGGTIFLDEIADTSPTFQAKLLRVLQEGEIKRVGGTQPIKIDVRVISATNKDLTDLVKAKAFRQDLYYRLAVLPVHLSPLRERRADIPLLVKKFIADSCQRHRQELRQVSEEAMRALTAAPWQGNVRELQHYIERAVVTTTHAELTCADLVALGSHVEPADLRTVGRDAAKQAERARILQALQQTSGNRMKAARLLKISRASLYNKLHDFGIR